MHKKSVIEGECVAGVVVLFNPNVQETLENIMSYIDALDILYCYDNSEIINNEFNKIEKCIYIPLLENKGLSYALSEGCEKAINDGATILMTFDQDTYFENDCVFSLVKYVQQNDKLCLVSPNIKRFIRTSDGKRKAESVYMYNNDIVDVDWVITSGCAFRKKTYRSVGGFDKKLFIAQIDQDFSYAVKANGGIIKRIGNLYMVQELGNALPRHIFWKTVYPPNYSPIRYYYIFRNERYLRAKWGRKYKICYAPLYKYLMEILLFEDKKIEKIKISLKGYLDGKKL